MPQKSSNVYILLNDSDLIISDYFHIVSHTEEINNNYILRNNKLE